MLGTHVVKVVSSTQIPVALSSGEAEWYALVKSATHGLGIKSALSDFNLSLSLGLYTDSSAANGVGNRRGAGGIRHIETRTLWLQDQVTRRNLTLRKIPKEKNNADLPTKYQDRQSILKMLTRMGYLFVSGKSSIALDT